MVAKEFAYIVMNPSEMSKDNYLVLEQLASENPYCQILTTLIAKGSNRFEKGELAQKKVGLAAAHSIDRDGLRRIITDKFVNRVAMDSDLTFDSSFLSQIALVEPVVQEEIVVVESVAPAEEIVAVVPAIVKKAKFVLKKDEAIIKQKQAMQLSIIEEFMVKSPGLIRSTKGKSMNLPTEDLSVPSVTISEEIITESYANILEMQGQKEKAVVVYQKLILKFPEKKGYFANRIAALS